MIKLVIGITRCAVMDAYDPETNWSVVDYHEQRIIRTAVATAPEFKLSIDGVLRATRLPATPSRVQYIRTQMVKRLQ